MRRLWLQQVWVITMWTRETCVELPLIVAGRTVGWLPDVPVTLSLDEHGDLVKVTMTEFGTDERMTIFPGGVHFDVVAEHHEANRARHMAEAGVPVKEEERDSPPVYGVGFNGIRYAA